MAVTAATVLQRSALRPSTRDFGTPQLIPTTGPQAGAYYGQVTVDSSTPAVVTAASNSVTSVTSASFSPPAGSVIVVTLSGNSSSGVNRSYTISNSGTALTWVRAVYRERQSSTNLTGSAVGVFYAVCPYGASGITVTSTPNTTTDTRQAMRVTVLNGVDLKNPVGAINPGQSPQTVFNDGTNYSQAPVRTSRPGSIVFTSISDWNAASQFAAATLTAFTAFATADLNGGTGYTLGGAARALLPMRITYGSATPNGHVASVEFQAALYYRAPGATVFFDDFERADGTPLANSYLRNGTFGGTFVTVSGTARGTTGLGTADNIFYRPLAVTGDFDLQATSKSGNTNVDSGLVGGFIDDSHWYIGTANPGTNLWGIYETTANAFVLATNVQRRPGDVVRLSKRGRAVALIVNGVRIGVWNQPDGTYDNGTGAVAGLHFWPDGDVNGGSSSVAWDNLLATVPAALPTPLFSDGFDRADADTLGANYTIIGPGTFGVRSGQLAALNISANDNFAGRPLAAGLTSYDVFATISATSATADTGVVCAYNNSSDWYMAYSNGSPNLCWGIWSMASNATVLTTTRPKAVGDVGGIRRRGRVLQLVVNNQVLGSYTIPNANFDTGKGFAGVYFWSDSSQSNTASTGRWDNLTATIPGAARPLPTLFDQDFGTSNSYNWGSSWTIRQNGLASSYPVIEGQGRILFAASSRSAYQLNQQFATADLESSGLFTWGQADGILQLFMRANSTLDAGQGYCLKISQGATTGTVSRFGTQASADSSETVFTSTQPLGFTASVGVPWRYRLQAVTQTSRVLIRIKTWLASVPEPTAWTEIADTSANRITSQNYIGYGLTGGAAGYGAFDDVRVSDATGQGSVVAVAPIVTGAGSGSASGSGTGAGSVVRLYRGMDTYTPPTAAETDDGGVWLGLEFSVTEDNCTLPEIRFWAPSTNNPSTAIRRAVLWDQAAQTQVGTNTVGTAVTAGAWNAIPFATPIALTKNKRYRAAVYHPAGRYSATAQFFTNGQGNNDVARGPLTIYAAFSVTGQQQGSYTYQTSGTTAVYPNNQAGGANYWTDVTVLADAPAAGSTITGSGTGSAAASATGAGVNSVPGTGSASGAGSATGAGALSVVAAGSASSAINAIAAGIVLVQGAGAPSGSGSGTGAGTRTQFATGAASASGNAVGAGISIVSTTGTASGSGSATGSGTATAAGAGTASGSGSATGAATVTKTASAAGSASGSATGAGLVQQVSTATASASGNATGAGSATQLASGTASATGSATGSGGGIVSSTGAASASASATGAGALTATGAATGASSGSGTGAGVRTVFATGSASGNTSASGSINGLIAGAGTPSAQGNATGAGYATTSGAGTGAASATGTGASTVTTSSTGSASSLSTATGAGTAVVTGAGTASASGSATGAGIVRQVAAGTASAQTNATAASTIFIVSTGTASGNGSATGAGSVVEMSYGAGSVTASAAGSGYNSSPEAGGGGGGSPATFVSANSAVHGGSYPTNGTLTVDCTGADELIIFMYVNSNLQGPEFTITVGGITAELTGAAYNNTTADRGRVALYKMSTPPSGVQTINYSQSAPNYNSERYIAAVAVKGGNYASVTGAGASYPPFGNPISSASVASGDGSLLLGFYAHYYPNNAPALAGPTGATVLTSQSATQAVKGLVAGYSGTGGNSAFQYNVDSFNNGTSYTMSIPAAAGGGGGGTPGVGTQVGYGSASATTSAAASLTATVTGDGSASAATSATGAGIQLVSSSASPSAQATATGAGIVTGVYSGAGAGSATTSATGAGSLTVNASGSASSATSAAAAGIVRQLATGTASAAASATGAGITVIVSMATGYASGDGTATGVVIVRSAAAGSATGSATGAGIGIVPGAGTASASGSATGAGVRIAVTTGIASATGSTTGAGSVTQISTATGSATGSATGAGTRVLNASATATGNTSASGSAQGLISGAGTPSAQTIATGSGLVVVTATGSASSSGSATGQGLRTATDSGIASAAASATGAGSVIVRATATGTSTGSATGAGLVTVRATGAASAAGSASGVAGPVTVRGAGTASSQADALGDAQGTAGGSADGVSTGSGTGAGSVRVAGAGTATASTSVSGAGTKTIYASGAGYATATATGAGIVRQVATGSASATGSAVAAGKVVVAATATGTSQGSATGAGTTIDKLAAAGTATTSAVGAGSVTVTGAATAASTSAGLGATGTSNVYGSGSAYGLAASIATGTRVQLGYGAGSASGSSSGAGSKIVIAQGSAAASGSASGASYVVKPGAGSASGSTNADGTGRRGAAGDATVSASSSATGAGSVAVRASGAASASASAAGTGRVSVTGYATGSGVTSADGDGTTASGSGGLAEASTYAAAASYVIVTGSGAGSIVVAVIADGNNVVVNSGAASATATSSGSGLRTVSGAGSGSARGTATGAGVRVDTRPLTEITVYSIAGPVGRQLRVADDMRDDVRHAVGPWSRRDRVAEVRFSTVSVEGPYLDVLAATGPRS